MVLVTFSTTDTDITLANTMTLSFSQD